MEVSNGLKPKIATLPDAPQEQNTAYVPSSMPKTLFNPNYGLSKVARIWICR